MLSSQTQDEKDAFFAYLDQLGQSDDEDVMQSEVNVRNISKVEIQVDSRLPKDTNRPHGGLSSSPSVQHLPQPEPKSDTAIPLSHTAVPKVPQSDRAKSANPKSRGRSKSRARKDIEMVPETDQLFTGMTFFFIPNDDIAKHRKLRIRAAISHGAIWTQVYSSSITHVIVDYHLDYDAAKKALSKGQAFGDVVLVRDTWVVESITDKAVQHPLQSRFRVKGAPDVFYQPKKVGTATCEPSPGTNPKKRKLQQIDELPRMKQSTESLDFNEIVREIRNTDRPAPDTDSLDDLCLGDTVSETSFEDDQGESIGKPRPSTRKNSGFQCMEKNDDSESNPNARTIQILQEMSTHYESTGEQWRTMAYRKAISALKKQTKLVRTKKEAVAIPQIGSSLAEKIEEIVTTNRLKSLDSAKMDPDTQKLQLFMGIYSVGLVQATEWVRQGHRTLDDLKQKAKLNANQRIGIEHYEDFQQRIPRNEVAEHASIVQDALRKVDSDLQAIIGGSYRRGNADSGDIDIIITKKDATIEVIRTLMMENVIPSLIDTGFLKVALASSTSRDRGSKWHGASCLPRQTTWRRIDLLFVPWSELGAAMIYFTGNDIFNRSLRLLASRKGMRLNQHGLYEDVLRGKGRVKLTEGKMIEGHDEMKIFDILGVPWRPPHERKC